MSVKQATKPAVGEELSVVPTPGKNFLGFLYLPIQRILAYYSLLKVIPFPLALVCQLLTLAHFQDLVSETPHDNSEYEALHAG